MIVCTQSERGLKPSAPSAGQDPQVVPVLTNTGATGASKSGAEGGEHLALNLANEATRWPARMVRAPPPPLPTISAERCQDRVDSAYCIVAGLSASYGSEDLKVPLVHDQAFRRKREIQVKFLAPL